MSDKEFNEQEIEMIKELSKALMDTTLLFVNTNHEKFRKYEKGNEVFNLLSSGIMSHLANILFFLVNKFFISPKHECNAIDSYFRKYVNEAVDRVTNEIKKGA